MRFKRPTGFLNRETVQFITTELSCALFFMHSHGLIHRDVKPENIFVDDNCHMVLGDFGTVSGRYMHTSVCLMFTCIYNCCASVWLCR